ncbi:type VI secretion system Vgr family protein [Citrobacter sedlakii]|uniref:type VI secretion system Vgr family protein n=1 Tax=Citrobacter sedlakii TaxID=67826 RepID=UPI001BA98836|nr:type VI secretion system Vgr family protein [Citrobacter sedlakii]EKJ8218899.1 type VI secretion system tip protein VgrG [Citrobacter sedlakii]QUC31633.1 type VI secretion system tip protein VgrG [Citrobacter sedlakii]
MSVIKSLLFSHSHHLLKVHGCSALPDVLSFEGEEALSVPFNYLIEFTSTDKAITPQQMLMQDATFTLQAPVDQGFGIKIQQPVRTIQGVVTAFERLSTSADETRYSLTLQPRMALLSRSHQNRIYQDMSVPDIVEHILRNRHDMRGEDFVFTLANEYPRREQVMQYGEDDLAFITRLLGEVGIWFRFTADTRLNIDVVEFYDDQRHYEQGLTLPSVPPSGQHDSGTESVWEIVSHHNVVQQSVFTRDYNYRNAPEDMSQSADATSGDSTTYGEAYHWADNYLAPGSASQRNPEPESGAFYARLRHERYLNNQTRLNGKTSSAALTPGQELKVTGGPDVTDIFRQGVVITRIHSSARRDRSYEVAFEAIPYSENYCFRPEPGDKPVMAGTLPARVTSTKTNDIYGHIDRDGRYRVNLLFDRDHWAPGEESLWVRQARPYAGDTYGLHLPLLAGTEVAIAFEQGDPDRPYIAGVLHDSAHGDHVTIQNYKRNVLRTPANNKIRLDDTRGKEHIKVSTEYGGKSQLNLGHLVDQQKQPRGEGAELRTDDWVSVRGGKGILLTAQAQPKATSQQLSMDEIKRQLSDALSLVESLSGVMQTAQLEPMDNSTQKNFLQQHVDFLQQPAIVAGAPGGIALSTPQHIQLSANGSQILTAGGNTEFSSLRRIVLAAKRGLVAFVHELGMKLVAAAGKVTIQAQTDAMEMTAMKGITITSSQDEIIISAQKKITLQCGGSYVTLSPDKIENGCGGDFKVKSANFNYAGPATLSATMPGFTACENTAADASEQGAATVPLS